MLMDAYLLLSPGQDLTAASAATPSTNTIDLVSSRDIGVSEVPVSVMFTVVPTSATAGATLNVAVQTSPDNVTWTTIVETSAQPIANVTASAPFILRSDLPVGVSRYLRLLYTPSAALTAGTVTAQIGGDFPAARSYPKNYTV